MTNIGCNNNNHHHNYKNHTNNNNNNKEDHLLDYDNDNGNTANAILIYDKFIQDTNKVINKIYQIYEITHNQMLKSPYKIIPNGKCGYDLNSNILKKYHENDIINHIKNIDNIKKNVKVYKGLIDDNIRLLRIQLCQLNLQKSKLNHLDNKVIYIKDMLKMIKGQIDYMKNFTGPTKTKDIKHEDNNINMKKTNHSNYNYTNLNKKTNESDAIVYLQEEYSQTYREKQGLQQQQYQRPQQQEQGLIQSDNKIMSKIKDEVDEIKTKYENEDDYSMSSSSPRKSIIAMANDMNIDMKESIQINYVPIKKKHMIVMNTTQNTPITNFLCFEKDRNIQQQKTPEKSRLTQFDKEINKNEEESFRLRDDELKQKDQKLQEYKKLIWYYREEIKKLRKHNDNLRSNLQALTQYMDDKDKIDMKSSSNLQFINNNNNQCKSQKKIDNKGVINEKDGLMKVIQQRINKAVDDNKHNTQDSTRHILQDDKHKHQDQNPNTTMTTMMILNEKEQNMNSRHSNIYQDNGDIQHELTAYTPRGYLFFDNKNTNSSNNNSLQANIQTHSIQNIKKNTERNGINNDHSLSMLQSPKQFFEMTNSNNSIQGRLSINDKKQIANNDNEINFWENKSPKEVEITKIIEKIDDIHISSNKSTAKKTLEHDSLYEGFHPKRDSIESKVNINQGKIMEKFSKYKDQRLSYQTSNESFSDLRYMNESPNSNHIVISSKCHSLTKKSLIDCNNNNNNASLDKESEKLIDLLLNEKDLTKDLQNENSKLRNYLLKLVAENQKYQQIFRTQQTKILGLKDQLHLAPSIFSNNKKMTSVDLQKDSDEIAKLINTNKELYDETKRLKTEFDIISKRNVELTTINQQITLEVSELMNEKQKLSELFDNAAHIIGLNKHNDITAKIIQKQHSEDINDNNMSLLITNNIEKKRGKSMIDSASTLETIFKEPRSKDT